MRLHKALGKDFNIEFSLGGGSLSENGTSNGIKEQFTHPLVVMCTASVCVCVCVSVCVRACVCVCVCLFTGELQTSLNWGLGGGGRQTNRDRGSAPALYVKESLMPSA